MTPNQEKLTALLKANNGKVLAMLAPSFPIDFKYPQIIIQLKHLGFDRVTELTFGARMVNYQYVEYIKSNPNQKYFITSPCPTCVTFIKNKYPELMQYLIPFASPMLAMAIIAKKHYPNHKIVFISPCFAKQNLEAINHPDVIDLVITFKELGEMISPIDSITSNLNAEFDSFYEEETKIYPISGGLAVTAGLKKILKPEDICIADEPKNLIPIFDSIKVGSSKFKFFDILNCPGGCIGGPGLKNNDLSIETKKQLVLDYKNQNEKMTHSKNVGNVKNELDLNFDTTF